MTSVCIFGLKIDLRGKEALSMSVELEPVYLTVLIVTQSSSSQDPSKTVAPQSQDEDTDCAYHCCKNLTASEFAAHASIIYLNR